jgi:transmembrane sensor
MGHGSPRHSIRDRAAAWHDRLHRDKVSQETRSACASWLAESAEHGTAYEAIDRTWSSLQSAAHDPQMLALRHETALRLARRTTLRTQHLRLSAAAVILLVLGITVAVFTTRSSTDWALAASVRDLFHSYTDSSYATARGERLTVPLEDGSQVTLDTQTELTVAFTKAERTVRLKRGQALFEVAKDRTRPFIVQVHNRRFVAVGTAFDVRLDGEQIKITMIEGTVRVERATSPNASTNATAPGERRTPRNSQSASDTADLDPGAAAKAALVATLTAGEQLIVDAASQDSVRPADADRATSWRRGQIVFDNTRLADAIAELNRYSDLRIELGDPALADLRLSGAFATGRPTRFLEAVTAYFPIEAAPSGRHTVLLRARP